MQVLCSVLIFCSWILCAAFLCAFVGALVSDLDASAAVAAGSISLQLTSGDLPRISYPFNSTQLNLWVCANSACDSGAPQNLINRTSLGGYSSLAWFPDDSYGVVYSTNNPPNLWYSYCRGGSCSNAVGYSSNVGTPAVSVPVTGTDTAMFLTSVSTITTRICQNTTCQAGGSFGADPLTGYTLLAIASRGSLPPAILWSFFDTNATISTCADSLCSSQNNLPVVGIVGYITAYAATSIGGLPYFAIASSDGAITVTNCQDANCTSHSSIAFYFNGNATELAIAPGLNGGFLIAYMMNGNLYAFYCYGTGCNAPSDPTSYLLYAGGGYRCSMVSYSGIPVIAFYGAPPTQAGLKLWWGTLVFSSGSLSLPSIVPGSYYQVTLPQIENIYGKSVTFVLVNVSVVGWNASINQATGVLEGCVPATANSTAPNTVTLFVSDGVTAQQQDFLLNGPPAAIQACPGTTTTSSASTSTVTSSSTGSTGSTSSTSISSSSSSSSSSSLMSATSTSSVATSSVTVTTGMVNTSCPTNYGGADCSCLLPAPAATAICNASVWVVAADLQNNQTVVVSSPVIVLGNYSQSSSGQLVVEVGASTPVSLNVSGCVQLGGELQIEFNSRPGDGQNFTLVQSQANCLSGNFSSVTIKSTYAGSECDNVNGQSSVSSSDFSLLTSVSSSGACGSHSSNTKYIIIGACVGGFCFLVFLAIVLLFTLRYSSRLKFMRRMWWSPEKGSSMRGEDF